MIKKFFPYSITSIGDSVFSYCSSLTNIIIPDTVNYIGDYSFEYCENLTDVYYTGNENKWGTISIGEGNHLLTNANIHYNYVPPVGDVNSDNKVAVDDVIYVLKYIVGNIELTNIQLINADVSNDNKVTVLDAVLIQKIILG
ncbi:MAG: leucine-rich repeat protein [Acutalibacteraceae bacterium]|nr:leucine-rich repeat protein [Acutalibacteraceae bacterium]